MQIIPAIDLKGGKCVRLTQGKFDQQHLYSNDPVKIAKRWIDEGATRLHIVDLDGARTGMPSTENIAIVREIIRRYKIPIQLGGGIRTTDVVNRMIAIGVDRVVLGTAAVSDPMVGETFQRLGERVVLGLDAIDGNVAIHGWQKATTVPAPDFARDMVAKGARRIIFTDVARDGMLNGPNLDALEGILRVTRVPVIASGGVATIDDIVHLAATGVEGVIVGKSLYEGTLRLPEAISVGG